MISISFEIIDEPPRLISTERMPYPIDKVWLAETDAWYVQQWWAPTDYINDAVEIAMEEGGYWRVIQRDPEGHQFSFYGRVDKVIPRELFRMTLTSEIFPEDQILVTQQFVASGPGTIVATTWEFPNAAALNRYVALGGPERQKGASARLDALLSQMLPK